MANLYGLARVILNEAGVTQIYGGDRCTYSDRLNFYSYRRDGNTGRMASLIWFV
jgi:copper oxidase (laccase) domain-containing protein